MLPQAGSPGMLEDYDAGVAVLVIHGRLAHLFICDGTPKPQASGGSRWEVKVVGVLRVWMHHGGGHIWREL